MSTVVCAPAPGNPAESWQDYLANHLGKFRAYFFRYFWRQSPEERQERIQEGLAQVCLVLSREAARGRAPSVYWSVYAKRAASKVARGSNCTRPMGCNADLLDKQTCAHGRYVFRGIYPEDSWETPDYVTQDWLGTLSAELRPVAELLLADCTHKEIATQTGHTTRQIERLRKELKTALAAYQTN